MRVEGAVRPCSIGHTQLRMLTWVESLSQK